MKKNAKSYNIVIVDDEPMVTSSLKTLLEFEGEYSPFVFNSPVEALDYIKKSEIDLVISDFLMPGINGIEFLTEVKNLHPGATLILLTGYADKESAIKAINEVGLYRYIEKPWDNADILLCIKNGIERSHLLENLEQKIKELSKAKIQLENYNTELENRVKERTIELERKNTELLELDRLREDFIATLTHDLRTPLLAAIQTLKFFLDGSLGILPERQNKLLETMLYSNQDMLGLVNALLEVYKYESGQLFLCKDWFDLDDFIKQCTYEVRSLIDKKGIELTIRGINGEKIYADKQELRRVLANLLGNAINYTRGKIAITLFLDNDKITVTVEDNGKGIPSEDIPKLFKRFSQGTSQKRSTGTGLGLYLSRQIVEAHNGKIWLESEVNKGSKFSFSIPKSGNTTT